MHTLCNDVRTISRMLEVIQHSRPVLGPMFEAHQGLIARPPVLAMQLNRVEVQMQTAVLLIALPAAVHGILREYNAVATLRM